VRRGPKRADPCGKRTIDESQVKADWEDCAWDALGQEVAVLDKVSNSPIQPQMATASPDDHTRCRVNAGETSRQIR
jgi:hypothetical protein